MHRPIQLAVYIADDENDWLDLETDDRILYILTAETEFHLEFTISNFAVNNNTGPLALDEHATEESRAKYDGALEIYRAVKNARD